MSLDIGALDSAGTVPAAANAAALTQQSQDSTSVGPNEDAVTVDTFPSVPPPELSDAIEAAAQAYGNLEAAGQHLHFAVDPSTGRLSIELHDLSGNVLGTVTPGQVLDVADGGQLPS